MNRRDLLLGATVAPLLIAATDGVGALLPSPEREFICPLPFKPPSKALMELLDWQDEALAHWDRNCYLLGQTIGRE